jgi:hypothetical protein
MSPPRPLAKVKCEHAVAFGQGVDVAAPPAPRPAQPMDQDDWLTRAALQKPHAPATDVKHIQAVIVGACPGENRHKGLDRRQ